MQKDTWYHLGVVKQDNQLSLYLNGQLVDTITVPADVRSSAHDFALGSNPHYTGASEHLACRVARLAIWVRALTAEEITQLAQPAGKPKL